MSGLVAAMLVGGGLLTSALALAATVVFVLKLKQPRSHKNAVATVILPLTGRAPQLERLLAALSRQTLPPRRLLIAIESEQDPAFARARAVLHSSPLSAEIVLTGPALSTAQKCWNQLVALRHIDDRDEAVVLLDGDILPQTWWLSALVSPLVDDVCDVVTGYRWLVLKRASLGAHLLAQIDRAIALLPRSPFTYALWGGTLALSRRAIDGLALPEILAATLADDCSIGEAAAAHGLRVLTRRALLVPSPIETGLAAAWHFGRRQYQIAHLYLPRLYTLALAAIAGRLLAWLVIACLLASDRAPWGAAAATLLIGLALASAAGQQLVARHLGMGDSWPQAVVQLGLAAAKPVVDLFHLSMLLGALYDRRMRWGHVVYRIDGPHRITVEKRLPWPS
jgi:Glycosyl transferase family 21